MTNSELDELRRVLWLRLQHAFGHTLGSNGRYTHHEANVEGFLRELECFIDAKVAEAVRRKERGRP
jgi:hypothetical protein